MHPIIEIIAKIFTITVLRYLILAGIPFLIFYRFARKYFTQNKIQARQALNKDFIREVLYSIQTSVVFAIIAWFILFTPFKKYTRVYDHLSDYPMWYLYISVPITLIIHDTYFYWMHRLLHHPRLFKMTHLLHHRSTNPSPWTSYSFHFIEAWTEGAVLFVIAFIMPVHELTVALFTVSSFVINVYGHLGYEIVPKGFRKTFLFEIFNTSIHHNLHHSKFKGNYGLYFRIWDRIMGTEHPDYVKEFDRVQEQRFGNTAIPQQLSHQG